MVAFNFSVSGYLYQTSIDTLRRSFEAASGPLNEEWRRARAELHQYLQHIENGGEPADQVDEDGTVILTRDEILQFSVDRAEAAIDALCKAFAITAYHQWERAIRSFAGASTKAHHDELLTAARKHHYPIHDGLTALRDLTNALKHSNTKWGLALKESWPEVVGPIRGPAASVNWYEVIQLRPHHLTEVFDIVKSSGPQGFQTA